MTTINETTTLPKNGRSRLECFINALETEIEQKEEEVKKYKSEVEFWQEQFAKEKTERERQMNLLRTVFMASNPAPCQGV